MRKPRFVELGLYREDKTERKTGETTYLDMTIEMPAKNAGTRRRDAKGCSIFTRYILLW